MATIDYLFKANEVEKEVKNLFCHGMEITPEIYKIEGRKSYVEKTLPKLSYNWKGVFSNTLPVYLDGKRIIELPLALKALYEEVQKSKYILELDDDWDDEGAIAYDKETWVKTVFFICNYGKWVWDNLNMIITTPNIYHGPDGSIDLYWKKKQFTLLLNIPVVDNEEATFYGETRGEQSIEGKIDLKGQEYSLLPNLLLVVK